MSLSSWQKMLSPILSPAGRIYSLGVAIKQGLDGRKALKLPLPTISIGNMAMGGTGKTPLCQFLAAHLAQKGMKPAILTRGYKSKPKSLPHLADAGDSALSCGDEPLMLARTLKGQALVIVDPDRRRGALCGLKHFNPDVFILDDGFQQVRVKRDLNILLLTPYDLEHGWNRVFPAGMWREGEKALERADMFLVNTWGQEMSRVKEMASARGLFSMGSVFFFSIEAEGLQDAHTGERSLDIHSRPYLLLTGVANPGKVVDSCVKLLGYEPASHLIFPDHYSFGHGFEAKLRPAVQQSGVRDLLCTSKDAVKINPLTDVNVWELLTRVKILTSQDDSFFQRVVQALGNRIH